MAGSAKIGSAKRPPIPSNEATVRPPAAVSALIPARANILNWTPAPAASPPGSTAVTALPTSPAATTANQSLVRRTRRCKPKLQVNAATSAAKAPTSQPGPSVDNSGHAPITRLRLGNTT